MKETWNLDPIYRGFDDPAFLADMEKLKTMAQQYNAFAAELESLNALDGLRKGIAWEEELTALARKLATYAQLTDSTKAIGGFYTTRQLLGVTQTIADCRAAFADITREQVVAAARRMMPDTVYFLCGTGAAQDEGEEDEYDEEE